MLKIFLSHLEISSVFHNFLKSLISQLETTYWRATDILCLSLKSHQEALMVDDSTRCKSLDHETLLTHALVKGDGNLDNSRLDYNQAVNRLCFREDRVILLVYASFHVKE